MKKGNFETFLVRDAVYTFGFVYDDKYREDGKRPLSFKLSKQDLRDLHSILSELLDTHKHKLKSAGLGAPSRCDCGFSMSDIIQEFLETETVKGECTYCCKFTELYNDGHCEKCWFKVHPSETVNEATKCSCGRYNEPWIHTPDDCGPITTPSNSEKEECCHLCRIENPPCSGSCYCHQTKEEPTTPEKCFCGNSVEDHENYLSTSSCRVKATPEKKPSERIFEIREKGGKEVLPSNGEEYYVMPIAKAIMMYLDEQYKKK